MCVEGKVEGLRRLLPPPRPQNNPRPITPANLNSACVPIPLRTDVPAFEVGRGAGGSEGSGPAEIDEFVEREEEWSRSAMWRAGTQLMAERGGWSKKSVSGCERKEACCTRPNFSGSALASSSSEGEKARTVDATKAAATVMCATAFAVRVERLAGPEGKNLEAGQTRLVVAAVAVEVGRKSVRASEADIPPLQSS